MLLKDLQDQVARDSFKFFPDTCNDRPETILFLTVALAGEVGEFANLVKKQHRGTPVTLGALANELPDILIYLLMIAEWLGVDLEHEYQEKRKYNVGRFSETK